MEHHGWEFVLDSAVEIYVASVWPIVVLVAVLVFKVEFKRALNGVIEKLAELIEVKMAGGSAKFHSEDVRLRKMSVKDLDLPESQSE
jgi:hypothetical protein